MDKISCGGFLLGIGLEQTFNDDGQPILNIAGDVVPEFSEEDEGKILKIVNGELKWVVNVPPTISFIIATAGGISVPINTPVESLKEYTTVKAFYSDDSFEIVDDYTLSGTIEVGLNNITVTYKEKTTTFIVYGINISE